MRPIKLAIEGFTAFRDKCEIDFSALDLFAITGQTGAGKTSLLDAMTYALYGRTSRLNKAGRDLISQGASNMSVTLQFRVGNIEYNVARSIKGSSVNVRLERSEGGDWKALAGSVSELSDQISGIVGLDFDGFTKAVILPQGKFDVFLRGKPDERRQVLNDLLDVSVYQQMMQSANERSKLAGERAKTKEVEIDTSATPEAKIECERELERASAQEQDALSLVEGLRQALPSAITLREKRRSAIQEQKELDGTQKKIGEATSKAAEAAKDVQRKTVAIDQIKTEIEATDYDSERHLRLMRLEPLAQQRESLREQLGREAGEQSALSDRLAAEEKNSEAARLAHG